MLEAIPCSRRGRHSFFVRYFPPLYLLGQDVALINAGAEHAAPNYSLDLTAIVALLLSGTIIFTTIHAQDFADCEGDKQSGRRTLPIVAPIGARIYMMVALVAWSVLLTHVWGLGPCVGLVLSMMGGLVGRRYYLFREISQDEKSYVLYNVSFAFCWASFAVVVMVTDVVRWVCV